MRRHEAISMKSEKGMMVLGIQIMAGQPLETDLKSGR